MHLQEVTRNIVLLWQQQSWWQLYGSTVPPLPAPSEYTTVLCWRKATVQLQGQAICVPFPNTCMHRDVLYMQV